MLRLLRLLFLDRRARHVLDGQAVAAPGRRRAAAPAAPPERSPAEALAEAEARMVRLPPEKAQLIRTAMVIHRAQQQALADLPADQRRRLEQMARRALLGQ
jgi:hypothetical protein